MDGIDELDAGILQELAKNGAMSVPELSKKTGSNASVIYSRIKRMTSRKIIKKFTITVDETALGIRVKATVGINRDPKIKGQIHESLLAVPEVVSIAEVTGRFDMMVQVHAKGLDELHEIVIEKIGKIEGIRNTETLVELEKTEKDPEYLAS